MINSHCMLSILSDYESNRKEDSDQGSEVQEEPLQPTSHEIKPPIDSKISPVSQPEAFESDNKVSEDAIEPSSHKPDSLTPNEPSRYVFIM